MPKRKQQLLSQLELHIMRIVWDRDEVTVADVREELRPERDLHHNTVMTTMGRLVKKGMLKRRAIDGRTHGYRAGVSREAMCERYMELVKEQFFSGSVAATIAGFLGLQGVPEKKIAKLEKMVKDLSRRES